MRLAHEFQLRCVPGIVAVGRLRAAERNETVHVIKIIGQRLSKINANDTNALTMGAERNSQESRVADLGMLDDKDGHRGSRGGTDRVDQTG